MAKYLVPVDGHLIIEANTAREAEIMALRWGQSLLCLNDNVATAAHSVNLTSSQEGIFKASSATVNAVSLSFSQDRIVDATLEIETLREQVVEKELAYRQRRGLPETDLTVEQLTLFAIQKEFDER